MLSCLWILKCQIFFEVMFINFQFLLILKQKNGVFPLKVRTFFLTNDILASVTRVPVEKFKILVICYDGRTKITKMALASSAAQKH